MIKNDQVYLEHIIEAIGKIEDFTKGISRFNFDGNVMIQDAVIRNIEALYEKQQRKFQSLLHNSIKKFLGQKWLE